MKPIMALAIVVALNIGGVSSFAGGINCTQEGCDSICGKRNLCDCDPANGYSCPANISSAKPVNDSLFQSSTKVTATGIPIDTPWKEQIYAFAVKVSSTSGLAESLFG